MSSKIIAMLVLVGIVILFAWLGSIVWLTVVGKRDTAVIVSLPLLCILGIALVVGIVKVVVMIWQCQWGHPRPPHPNKVLDVGQVKREGSQA